MTAMSGRRPDAPREGLISAAWCLAPTHARPADRASPRIHGDAAGWLHVADVLEAKAVELEASDPAIAQTYRREGRAYPGAVETELMADGGTTFVAEGPERIPAMRSNHPVGRESRSHATAPTTSSGVRL